MEVLTHPDDLATRARNWQKEGLSIALVPTMGYYHAGHKDLIRHGRSVADRLVVSLFVNPAQFGPAEDLDAYPRDFEGDCAAARELGADALFAPRPEDLYKPDHAAWVEVPDMGAGLCGKSRPGHFRGVCTIVLKLLLLSRATLAVFGEKDWQQQAIIRRMCRDLNVPARIVSRPTVREADGLALSSRNVYLTADERAQAPHIYAGLRLAAAMVQDGERDGEKLRHAVLAYWARRLPAGRLDYLEIVDRDSLRPMREIAAPCVMACAARLGRARLIDNILLQP